MENPNGVAVTDVLIILLLRTLVQPDRNLLLLLLRSNPRIENRLLLEIEVVILDLEALIDLDIEEGGRIEGDVGVDVLLVVEARLEVEHTELAGDFQQFEDVLVGLLVLDVGQVLGTVDVLQHEVFVVLDGELLLLVHQTIVLAQLELELVNEYLDLLLGSLDALLLGFVPLLQQPLQKLLRLELDYRRNFEQGHTGFSWPVVGREGNDRLEGDTVGVEIEVVLLTETGDVHRRTEMQVRVQGEGVVHLNIISSTVGYYRPNYGEFTIF
jgi:hypothetical protein